MKALVRIVLAVATIIIVIIALIRQPVIGATPYTSRMHSDPDALRRHVAFLAATPRSSRDIEGLDVVARYIAQRFREAGARVEDEVFVARRATYRNVVATFGPQSAPLLVVGAHYDAFRARAISPAADDNASGVAGLLELARLLGGSQRQLQRRVRLVAFSTEEPPFFGSDEMGSAINARALANAHERVEGMISLEMIGYFTPRQPWTSWVLSAIYPSRGDFIAVAGGWRDRSLARELKRGIAGAGMHVCSFTAPHSWSDASDQRSYWNRGFPAVMLTDTAYERNPNYHTTRDTPETLDYRTMARVVDGVFNFVVN
jgi:Zn-dependent M28 family amino/carboxypeptidase